MRWLEVRRHSLTEKGAARGRGSQLSAEGVALARLVGAVLGPFASVVTSASPRAIETAVAMGLAVDGTVELPSGYVPGEVEHHDQWRWPRPYRTYAELLGRGGRLAAVAKRTKPPGPGRCRPCRRAPLRWWCATGAASSQGWWPACRTPTTGRGGRRSATATARAWASRTAASSASSFVGHRGRANPPWRCTPGTVRGLLRPRWSWTRSPRAGSAAAGDR